MKNLGLLKIVAAAALLALPLVPAPVSAQTGAKEKPLRGVVRPSPRRGGYSYKYLQGVDTRKFVDPGAQSQSISGPFDSGFFFIRRRSAAMAATAPTMN